MRHIKTSSLHRGVAGARHSFLPVPALTNKLDLLSQACPCTAAEHTRPILSRTPVIVSPYQHMFPRSEVRFTL